ncbi:hypothetical protein T440DRAFT_473472 [Plenodomus tracheiphilus IPT5]|uniref:Uncharacterized protein n=1 Tax=Plenodomus tracheiphilus IPT5 TaxID=1408161 RepID=A0A6A7APT2_9PLEO|nr:hypothetical protein T440DRAFT_473472 [Plenodomus tracheiphilus IPT5]
MDFECDPDVVWDRLRTDTRMRNLTIYAQWVSVTAAALLYLPTFYALYRYLIILVSDEVHSFTSLLLLTLDLGPLNLLYPLLPLELELPHYIRSKPLKFWSTATCLAMPARFFATLFEDPFNTSFIAFASIGFTLYITLIAISVMHVSAMHVSAQPSMIGSHLLRLRPVGVRFCINLVYCIQLGIPVLSSSFYRFRIEGGLVNGFMSLLFWFTACLFGVAALLYIAAMIKRHSWVSSTLLGGTGIEPMVLWLPVTGPSHQSIGNEVQEGAVQLV